MELKLALKLCAQARNITCKSFVKISDSWLEKNRPHETNIFFIVNYPGFFQSFFNLFCLFSAFSVLVSSLTELDYFGSYFKIRFRVAKVSYENCEKIINSPQIWPNKANVPFLCFNK